MDDCGTPRSFQSGVVPLQRILMPLRANQLRIAIYRDHLLSSDRILSNMASAQLAVDVAKHTIGLINHANEASHIYDASPGPLNHFIVSALGVLFLAVCHAPSVFSASVHEDYQAAIGLLKRGSSASRASPRLRKLIGELKSIALTLGLAGSAKTRQLSPSRLSQLQNPADSHSNQRPGDTFLVNQENASYPPSTELYDYNTSDTFQSSDYQQSWELGDLFLNAANPFFNSTYNSSKFPNPASDRTAPSFPNSVDIFGFDNDQQLTEIIADFLR